MRPVMLVTFNNSSLSGGYQRLYELLKRGKSKGIDYIIITDSKSCENASKIFPDFMEILGNYKVIQRESERKETSIPGLKQIYNLKRNVEMALFISQVAKNENADLIITPSEGTERVLISCIASKFCSKPWTALFQPTEDILQPSYNLKQINPLNVLAHIKSKKSTNNLSLLSKIGLSINLLLLLKAAENTAILTVSNSVVEDFGYLNSRIKFVTITPGNGIEPTEFPTELPENIDNNCVFFARLIPEKGIFDLAEIWKHVIQVIPDVKLVICGISENSKTVKKFLTELETYDLHKSVTFLGKQDKNKLFSIVANSSLTIYPSYVDSFSLVTLESLACGTPVVAYDIPAIKHNFSKCKAVFRCPVGNKTAMANKVIHVLTKEKRSFLAQEAKKFVGFCNWDDVVLAEKQAYAKIIEISNRKS